MTMMNCLRCSIVALMLTPAMGAAQDFDAGVAAYNAGDYVTAVQEWRPLAEQGDASAQSNLGWMYANGHGVAQDHAEAAMWYLLAAEQGNATAQFNLGGKYRFGQGVAQDFTTAHMWYNIAAAQGEELAGVMRDIVADLMTAQAISEAQRRARVCMGSAYRNCD